MASIIAAVVGAIIPHRHSPVDQARVTMATR
jgi:hypothetical protein